MIILLLGPQGAGKGTQGAILSKAFGIPILGAGDLLREEAETGSELGMKIKDLIDAGKMAPLGVVTDLLVRRLECEDAKGGVIIDGYPRDASQLSLMLEKFTPDIAVILQIDDDTAVRRLGGRWVCKERHIYNIDSNPPKVSGVCDIDGLPVFQREDDKEKAIRERLSIYHNETEPIIEELERVGVCVVKIDATPSIDAVAKSLSDTVGKTCGIHRASDSYVIH